MFANHANGIQIVPNIGIRDNAGHLGWYSIQFSQFFNLIKGICGYSRVYLPAGAKGTPMEQVSMVFNKL